MCWRVYVGGVLFLPAILATPLDGGEPSLTVGQVVIMKGPDCPVLLDYMRTPPQTVGRARMALQVVKVEGDWLWVHANKGMGWLHRRDAFTAPEALAYFSARIKDDPKNAEAWARRGMARLLNKEQDEGFRDLSEAIRLNPAASECFHMRSVVWLARRDIDRAMADLVEASRLDPASGQILSDQATLWDLKGDRARMRACVAEALRLDPVCADAYCHCAMLWEDAHEDARALADYNKAIELNRGHSDSYLNRALLHFRQREYDATIQDLTESLPLFKDPAHAYHLRAEAWLAKSEPDKALADIGQALRVYPTHPEALATRAKALTMKGTSVETARLAPPPAAPPLEFKEHVSEEGRFGAQFPGAIIQGSATVPNPDAKLTMKFVGVAVSSDLAYQVCHCDYPAAMIRSPQKFLEEIRENSKGELLHDAVVTFSDPHHPGETLPARDILIKSGRYRRVRMILDGTRLYMVQIIGSREAVTSADADRFFKSFRIMP